MKKWTLGLFLLMCGSLALAACGGGGKTDNSSSNKTQSKETTKRLPVPENFKDMKPPAPLDNPDLIAKGKALFHDAAKANCVQCHGEGGKGDGPNAHLYTDPAPADLTSPEFQDAVTDQYIFWRITDPNESKAYPNSGMLGYAAGTAEQRWQLVAYVRSLKAK